MNESKAAITQRLRREGRWEEASKFRDEARVHFRQKGEKRSDAAEKAWIAMAERFPPRPTPEVASDPTSQPNESIPTGGEYRVACDGSRDLNLVRDTVWVYDHLDVPAAIAGPAPSRGAWSMLGWARSNRERFFEQMLPKAMAQARNLESEKKPPLLDNPKKLEWLDEYLANLHPGPRKGLHCPACNAQLVLGHDDPAILRLENPDQNGEPT